MSTARILLLFVLLLTVLALAVLVLAAAFGWELGALSTALMAYLSWAVGLLMRSPLGADAPPAAPAEPAP